MIVVATVVVYKKLLIGSCVEINAKLLFDKLTKIERHY